MDRWIDFQQTLTQRDLLSNLSQFPTKTIGLEGHALIRGVAGAGKSWQLGQRSEMAMQSYERILVLTYNRFMKAWLQSKIGEIREMSDRNPLGATVDCKTFHEWSRGLNYQYEWDQDPALRKQMIGLAKWSGLNYQAIFVDEAQDFYDEWFQALLTVLDRRTQSLFFVYDNTQSIYGPWQGCQRPADWSWNKLGIEVRGRSQILDINYRNAPEILELAWQYLYPFLQSAGLKVERRTPDHTPALQSILEPKKCLDRSSQRSPGLIQVAAQEMPLQIARQVQLALDSHPASSIGILTHPSLGRFRQAIAQALQTAGIPHQAPQTSSDRQGNVVRRPWVIVDSWNALKGVEFDAVILVGIDLMLEDGEPDRLLQSAAGLYTAMTRARDHLVILYDEQNATVERLQAAIASPGLLQAHEGSRDSSPPPQHPDTPESQP
ncbi:MAG: AAA family ATPase [Synechococcales bacterium]|nr:AAA family ATPase [Synechococcales bacterium]